MLQETKIECYRNAYQKCKELDFVSNLGYPEEKKNLEFSCNIGDIEVEYNLRMRTDFLTIKGAKRYPNEPDSRLTEIGQRLTEGKVCQFTAYNETIVFQLALPLVGIADEDAKRKVGEETEKFIFFLHKITESGNESEENDSVENDEMHGENIITNDESASEEILEHSKNLPQNESQIHVNETYQSSDIQEETEDTEDRRNQLEWIVEKKNENLKCAADLERRTKELEEKEEDLQKRITAFGDHSKEIMGKLELLGKREQELQEKEDALTYKENEIVSQNASLDKKNQAITNRAKDLKSLEEKLTAKESLVEDKSKEIKKMEENLSRREKDLSIQENNLKEQERVYIESNNTLKQQYENMEKKKEDAEKRLAVCLEQKRNSNVKVAQLEENHKFVQEQLDHYLEENKSLKERCVTLQNEGKEYISRANESLREIERLKMTVEQTQKNAAIESEQSETDKRKLEEFYAKEMKTIHDQYKQEISKLKQESEQEVQSLQERFQSEKSSLKQSFEQQLNANILQMNTEQKNQIAKFENEKKEIYQQYQSEKENLVLKFEQEKASQDELYQKELLSLKNAIKSEKEQHEEERDRLRVKMLEKAEEQVAAEAKVWEERLSAASNREREFEQRISSINVQFDNANQKLALCKEQLTYSEARAKNAENESQQLRSTILEMQKEIDKYKRNGADFGTPDEVLTDFAETRKENRMLKREIEDIRMENEAIENSLLSQIQKLHEEKALDEKKRIEEAKAREPESIAQFYVQELQTSGIVLNIEVNEQDVFVKGQKENCSILIDVKHNIMVLTKPVVRGGKYLEQCKEWNREDLTESYTFEKKEIVCKKVITDITLDINKILRRFLPLK